MLYPDHFGHQAGDVEYDLRKHKGKRLLYLAGNAASQALRRIHERYVTIWDIPKWLRRNFIYLDVGAGCLDETLSRELVIYNDADTWKLPPTLKFNEVEEEVGSAFLKAHGLKPGKYVCFHARDMAYGDKNHAAILADRGLDNPMTESHPFQRHRNSDFSLYMETITWLQTQGLKAVRLGSEVSRAYEHDNLVDYAGNIRSRFGFADFLDLYIMANAKLYVGQGSGVTMMSGIFNVPGVAVNFFPYFPGSRPQANIKVCRVKRLKIPSRELTDFESRHYFDFASWSDVYGASMELEVIENTPAEILATVQTAMERMNGNTHPN